MYGGDDVIQLTEKDFEKYAKKVKGGAKTAFIKGGVVAAPKGGGGGSGSSAAAAAEPLSGKKRGRSRVGSFQGRSAGAGRETTVFSL